MTYVTPNSLKQLQQVIGSEDLAGKVEKKGVEIAKVHAVKVMIFCQLEVEAIKRKGGKETFSGLFY